MFEEIAAELYALKPDGFAAARDQRIKQAKEAGDKELAKELQALRKPTQSAWLVNKLWRDQGEVMEQLFKLSSDLSGAQARASGEELRNLTTQRRAIESALLTRARALGQESGVSLSPETEREVQETLSAALADPQAADQVRSGRLIKPIEYAGFGMMAMGPTAAPPTQRQDNTAEKREPTPLRRKEAQDPEAEKRERERQRARERLQAAQAAAMEAVANVQAAQRELDQHTKGAESTRHELEELRQEVDRLRKRERDLEDELSKQERAAREAAREHEQAQKEHAAAVRVLEDAEEELSRL